jgi:hypothetical protein
MFEDKIKLLVPHFGKAKKNLYTWKELESLINLRPFMSSSRFNAANSKETYDLYGDKVYEWKNTGWSTESNAWPVSCLKDILSKTSVYIQDCSRANEKINAVCRQLEGLLSSNSDCHIYFSVDKSLPNFNKHNDLVHNLIIVSDGTIRCELFIENGHIIEKELSNGDYVFIPAGMYHRITPLSEKRLSLSFPIYPDKASHYEEREWLRLDNL